jgi:hypothetical protein
MNIRRIQIAAACGVACALLAGGAAVGAAQEKQPERPERAKTFAVRGTFELGGSVSYSASWSVANGSTSGSALHQVTAMPYAGYFVIDGLELGVNPLGFTYVSQGSAHLSEFKVLGSVAYNFRLPSRVYPFVEGLAGYAFASGSGVSDRGGFSWGGRGGLKVGIAGGALLTVGVQYLQVTLKPSGVTARSGYNELGAVVGFSVWL